MTESTEREIAEIWALFRESREQILLLQEQSKETDRRFQETDRMFKETELQMRDTDRKINKMLGKFDDQWGLLIENLVKPSALRLFKEWGITVDYISPRVESHKNGDTMEIDLLLANSIELVVVETKSRVSQQDVEDLLEDLEQFPRFFPKYSGYRIYGAIAGLDVPQNVGRWAYRQGLFVLSLTGEGLVTIKNDEKFKPKDFSN
jgi:hypothetical protein